jgi:hypothetical protein
MIDYEKIEESIAKLDEDIRHDRLERGVPEEAPSEFLPEDYSAVLASRLTPFKKIAVTYAKLLMDSGELYPINTAKLEKYRKVGELLSMSEDIFSAMTGAGVLDILRYMGTVNEAIKNDDHVNPDYVAEHIYLDIQLFTNGHDRGQYTPAQFINTTKRYRRHYESIRHLI